METGQAVAKTCRVPRFGLSDGGCRTASGRSMFGVAKNLSAHGVKRTHFQRCCNPAGGSAEHAQTAALHVTAIATMREV